MKNKADLKNWQKMTLVGKLFHQLGIFLLNRTIGQQFALFYNTVTSIFSSNRNFKTDSRNIIQQIFFTGIEIMPILFVVATLFGTITIIEVITFTGKMGFSDNVGTILVATIIRELGPVFTAFLIAGRSGSSLTTYIGSMVINSEVDALATMGVNPVRYLVMPSLIGGIVATFMMTIMFNVCAVCCGFVTTKFLIFITGNSINIQLTWSYLSTEIISALNMTDFVLLLLKPFVFGIIITTNACYQALNIHRDIRQLPKATSRSVVKSFLYVVCADIVLSIFYFVDYMNNLSLLI
ncbi:MAG: ABC transporter permease [Fibrobacter sp.]|nr:ABC transporter permease [Fibrobacter sp.]